MAQLNFSEIRHQLETKVSAFRNLFPRHRSNMGETNILPKKTEASSEVVSLNLFSPDHQHSSSDLPQEDSNSNEWTDTQPIDQRPSKALYREQEISQVKELLNSGRQKVVLLEGQVGVGKTSTVLELVADLRSREVPFSIFSPKELDATSLEALYDQLLAYTRQSEKPVAVIIDSGDYLATKNNDQAYNQVRMKLMQLLASPQFRIVSTYHPDWITPDDVVRKFPYDQDLTARGISKDDFESRRHYSPLDKELYQEWLKVFVPSESVFTLSEKVEPEKGVAVLKDHLITQASGSLSIEDFSQVDDSILLKIASSPSATFRKLKRFPLKYFKKLQHDNVAFAGTTAIDQNIESILKSIA